MSPAFASMAVANFWLMIASDAPRPEPSHTEPFARTNRPRSCAQSNPIRFVVGSKRRVDGSTTAPPSWNRGATPTTSGMFVRFA